MIQQDLVATLAKTSWHMCAGIHLIAASDLSLPGVQSRCSLVEESFCLARAKLPSEGSPRTATARCRSAPCQH